MWLALKLEDGSVTVIREDDVRSITQMEGAAFCQVLTSAQSQRVNVLRLSTHRTLSEALLEMVRLTKAQPQQACRVCGCTEDDCSGCVERTGERCFWVAPDLCSACWPEAEAKAEHDLAHVAQSSPPAKTA
jgi:hypothetical protein